MKLNKGDKVLVLAGKDRGKSGTITKVLPSLNKVVIDGINVVKRHVKPSTKSPKGGIIEMPRPISVSNVGIIHPADNKRASRIGYAFNKAGDKVRVYRQASNREIKEHE